MSLSNILLFKEIIVEMIQVVATTVHYIEVSKEEAINYMNKFNVEDIELAYSEVACEKTRKNIHEGLYDDIWPLQIYKHKYTK